MDMAVDPEYVKKDNSSGLILTLQGQRQRMTTETKDLPVWKKI
jgi:hypothetical protein